MKDKALGRRMAMALLALALFSAFTFILVNEPSLTGWVVRQDYTSVPVNEEFMQDNYYYLDIDGEITSLLVSGRVIGEGRARIYLGDLLVMDSDLLESKGMAATGKVVADEPVVDFEESEDVTDEVDDENADESLTEDEGTDAEDEKIKEFSGLCVETCSIRHRAATITIVVENAVLVLDEISYKNGKPKSAIIENVSYAEINKPVRWDIKVDGSKTNAIKIPAVLEISSDNDIMILEDNKIKSRREFNEQLQKTPAVVLFDEGITSLTYYTEAPVATERIIGKHRKLVTVSADHHYENVLAYTDITEAPQEAIRVYWLKDTGRELFSDVTYIDANGNGLINRIEWVIPHLSEQTFEISINVLNVQSYPVVGGEWTVMFETTGMADLMIRAVDGTTWSNVNEDNDLKLLEIRCGDDVLDYIWADDTAIIKDYECDETGFETSKVITPGKHYLEFDFGGLKASARNDAFVIVQVNFTANSTWEVPDGVTSIMVEAWGGGAAGAGQTGSSTTGSGGGGAYATRNISVTPGETLSIAVAGAVAGSSGDGANGTPSWVKWQNTSTAVYADFGRGGTATAGGAAGLASNSIGTIRNNGGAGAFLSNSLRGGGGGAGTYQDGSAATSGTGGAGGNDLGGQGGTTSGNNLDGGDGSDFGGGGGNVRKTGAAGTLMGGGGAAGFVRITYEQEVPNQAPTITAPTITPTQAYTTSDLSCNATPSDAENTTLTVEWAWYNNSVLHSSGNTTGLSQGVNSIITTLGSGNTNLGEEWNCTVRAYDGELYSDFRSATITIQDLNPVISSVEIWPSPLHYSFDAMCNATAIDAENQTMTVEWHWYNVTAFGNVLILSGNTTGIENGTNSLVAVLGAGNASAGETWNCTVRAFDGMGYSDYESSIVSIVSNLPPTHDTPFITPSTPNSNQQLTCNWNNVYDADGDPVTNITAWHRNSQPLLSLYLPFEGGYAYAKDYSGNSNHGDIYGATLNRTGGIIGGAMEFSGISNPIWGDSAYSFHMSPNSNHMNGIYCDDEFCYGAHTSGYLTKVAKNGTVIWGTGGSSSALQPNSNHMNGIYCDDEFCYGAHASGYLTKVAKNGTVIWGTGGSSSALQPDTNIMYGIYCDGEFCYGAHASGYLTKVAKNGTVIWGTGGSSSALQPYTTIMYDIYCDGEFCYGAHASGYLTKVAKNGTVIWGTGGSSSALRPNTFSMNGIACDDEFCYGAHTSGYLTKVAKNGTVIWGTGGSSSALRPNSNHMNGIACDDEFCYGAHTSGYLTKVAKNGTVILGTGGSSPALQPYTPTMNGIACDGEFCYGAHTSGYLTKVAKNGTSHLGHGRLITCTAA
jgi:hypothetical protein